MSDEKKTVIDLLIAWGPALLTGVGTLGGVLAGGAIQGLRTKKHRRADKAEQIIKGLSLNTQHMLRFSNDIKNGRLDNVVLDHNTILADADVLEAQIQSIVKKLDGHEDNSYYMSVSRLVTPLADNCRNTRTYMMSDGREDGLSPYQRTYNAYSTKYQEVKAIMIKKIKAGTK